ncbi:MAG: polymer-forming cytoskeletal protein [Candidatus Aminicenantales bacterium]
MFEDLIDNLRAAIYNRKITLEETAGRMQKSESTDNGQDTEMADPKKASLIGSSIIVHGELAGQEDIVIRGQFKGQINLKNHSLFIDSSGQVEADISAKNVTIYGSVLGNICASGKVFVAAEAHITGNITALKISIMDGAQFKGSIKIEPEAEPLLF